MPENHVSVDTSGSAVAMVPADAPPTDHSHRLKPAVKTTRNALRTISMEDISTDRRITRIQPKLKSSMDSATFRSSMPLLANSLTV